MPEVHHVVAAMRTMEKFLSELRKRENKTLLQLQMSKVNETFCDFNVSVIIRENIFVCKLMHIFWRGNSFLGRKLRQRRMFVHKQKR